MAKEDLTSRVDVAGGYGKSAKYRWSVLRGKKVLDSGTVTGAQSQAYDAIAEAMQRIREAESTDKKPKKPAKWGNFLK